MKLPEAEPTIRHGDQVSYVETEKMPIEYMAGLINKFRQKGYSSAAIICKDEEEANTINSRLRQIGIDVPNVTSSDADYNGGVCTITCQLAKGLEFDGVIISDASEHIYDSERIGDMKLLYVAMTRPLHELYVLHSGGITKPLEADKKKLGNVARVKDLN
jgi:DNA helicase-2/ATP-dependent DNA helicase PcrA